MVHGRLHAAGCQGRHVDPSFRLLGRRTGAPELRPGPACVGLAPETSAKLATVLRTGEIALHGLILESSFDHSAIDTALYLTYCRCWMACQVDLSNDPLAEGVAGFGPRNCSLTALQRLDIGT